MEDSRTPKDEGSGYEDFGEVARNIERVVDVVWVSGTRMTALKSQVFVLR